MRGRNGKELDGMKRMGSEGRNGMEGEIVRRKLDEVE